MDILDYDDYRQFLEDWRGANPEISYREFMRLVGSKDPSVLQRIISGKRGLPIDRVDDFAVALGLDEPGSEVLRLLVRIAHVDTERDRQAAQRKLAGIRAYQAALRLRRSRLFADWLAPLIKELATCGGFRRDPDWVARVVDPPVSVAEATEALSWHREDPKSVVSEAEVRQPDVFGYYRGMHDRAAHALDRLETDADYVERSQFLGLTVAVPESLLPLLRERLHEVQCELLGLCDGAGDQPDQVVQINLQLFPLTTRVPTATGVVPNATEPAE